VNNTVKFIQTAREYEVSIHISLRHM